MGHQETDQWCRGEATLKEKARKIIFWKVLGWLNMDEAPSFFNKPKINIGVLGHVDSGKTSLCGALSTILSTAALDKNPQSQERGITLDLQFSAMETDNYLYTFTDCPGHASLIRTIIGGAQIIDMVLLVIDVNKGMQTQTAEGLVIAGTPIFLSLVSISWRYYCGHSCCGLQQDGFYSRS